MLDAHLCVKLTLAALINDIFFPYKGYLLYEIMVMLQCLVRKCI